MMKDPFDQSDEIVPFVEEFAGASNNQASAGGTHRRKDDQSLKSGNYVSVDCSFVWRRLSLSFCFEFVRIWNVADDLYIPFSFSRLVW